MSEQQEADSETPRPRTTRPALDVLDRDQNRLLFDGEDTREPTFRPLIEGFDTYWQLLCWYQAAAVRTLGHVSKVMRPRALVPEADIPDALVRGYEPRHRYVRQRLVESLTDACDMAYRQMRNRAVERAGEDVDFEASYQRVDTERQRNPVLRPAFRRMDQEQAGALIEFWPGFEDREALSRWVHSLRAVSNGETPPNLMDEIIHDQELLRVLLNQEDEAARLHRYRFAVLVVLPTFLRAARTLRGGEQVDTEPNPNPWNEVRDNEWEEAKNGE